MTVSRPGIDQEEIIQAVPLTRKRGVQIPHLANPISDPNFVPTTQPLGVGLPVIHFPSLFYPNTQTSDDMLVQRRSIDIGSVLRTSLPQSSDTSSLPSPPGFAQGEDVMRKRKRAEDDKDEEEQERPPTEPPKKKSPSKKGKNKPS